MQPGPAEESAPQLLCQSAANAAVLVHFLGDLHNIQGRCLIGSLVPLPNLRTGLRPESGFDQLEVLQALPGEDPNHCDEKRAQSNTSQGKEARQQQRLVRGECPGNGASYGRR